MNIACMIVAHALGLDLDVMVRELEYINMNSTSMLTESNGEW